MCNSCWKAAVSKKKSCKCSYKPLEKTKKKLLKLKDLYADKFEEGLCHGFLFDLLVQYV